MRQLAGELPPQGREGKGAAPAVRQARRQGAVGAVAELEATSSAGRGRGRCAAQPLRKPVGIGGRAPWNPVNWRSSTTARKPAGAAITSVKSAAASGERRSSRAERGGRAGGSILATLARQRLPCYRRRESNRERALLDNAPGSMTDATAPASALSAHMRSRAERERRSRAEVNGPAPASSRSIAQRTAARRCHLRGPLHASKARSSHASASPAAVASASVRDAAEPAASWETPPGSCR